MANIATNTYLFYGDDKEEIIKCHKTLNDLFEKIGSNESCVPVPPHNAEWIYFISDINPDVDHADIFYMDTESKWYGNPTYWQQWVKENFPKLSVAFRCYEPGFGIFEQVDPDNMFSAELVFLYGTNISATELEKLPIQYKDYVGMNGDTHDDGYYIFGAYDKSELFNDNFKSTDLPESIEMREFTEYTYEELQQLHDLWTPGDVNDPDDWKELA